MKPEISIVMTAFNSSEYLAEAIQSILQQETERTWELLFVDDGSTDNSLAIAQYYSDLTPRHIHVFTHPGGVNRGISASRNLGLLHAGGEVVAFLDSDDIWLPHHLETLATLLENMPEVAMVYAGAERWVNHEAPFDEAASRSSTWGANYIPPLVPPGRHAGLVAPGELLGWFREDESLVPCICSVMVRFEAARAVNFFCERFRGVYDDQVFHAKIASRYGVYALDVCVARYRQHGESCCAQARLIPQRMAEGVSAFGDFLQEEIEQEDSLQ